MKLKQIELLGELRRSFELAVRAGVHPEEIDRAGYDQGKDERWTKWPWMYKQDIEPITNYVILKDGRRIDLPIDWKAERDKLKKR